MYPNDCSKQASNAGILEKHAGRRLFDHQAATIRMVANSLSGTWPSHHHIQKQADGRLLPA